MSSMNSAVTAKQYENICVLTVSNPPVNAVDAVIRAGLIAAVREAEADAAIKAVVIMGAGRNFIAGADLAAVSYTHLTLPTNREV